MGTLASLTDVPSDVCHRMCYAKSVAFDVVLLSSSAFEATLHAAKDRTRRACNGGAGFPLVEREFRTWVRMFPVCTKHTDAHICQCKFEQKRFDKAVEPTHWDIPFDPKDPSYAQRGQAAYFDKIRWRSCTQGYCLQQNPENFLGTLGFEDGPDLTPDQEAIMRAVWKFYAENRHRVRDEHPAGGSLQERKAWLNRMKCVDNYCTDELPSPSDVSSSPPPSDDGAMAVDEGKMSVDPEATEDEMPVDSETPVDSEATEDEDGMPVDREPTSSAAKVKDALEELCEADKQLPTETSTKMPTETSTKTPIPKAGPSVPSSVEHLRKAFKNLPETHFENTVPGSLHRVGFARVGRANCGTDPALFDPNVSFVVKMNGSHRGGFHEARLYEHLVRSRGAAGAPVTLLPARICVIGGVVHLVFPKGLRDCHFAMNAANPSTLLALMYQMLRALDAFHTGRAMVMTDAKGNLEMCELCHGDVKPHNFILINEKDGSSELAVKVIDLEFATTATERPGHPLMGRIHDSRTDGYRSGDPLPIEDGRKPDCYAMGPRRVS